jgi:hypothetical protein
MKDCINWIKKLLEEEVVNEKIVIAIDVVMFNHGLWPGVCGTCQDPW